MDDCPEIESLDEVLKYLDLPEDIEQNIVSTPPPKPSSSTTEDVQQRGWLSRKVLAGLLSTTRAIAGADT